MGVQNIQHTPHFAYSTPPLRAMTASPGSTVLFVTSVVGRPVAPLVRTATLARRMASRLLVLAVTGDLRWPRRSRPRGGPGAAGTSVEDWARRMVPWATIETAPGDLRHAATRVSGALAPRLIVVPRGELVRPSDAIDLAHACGAPVLVARPAAGNDTVLAASDLRDPRASVVRMAAEVALHFGAPLLVLHNAERGSSAASRLGEVLARLDVAADGVLVSSPSTTDALLGAARARDVDLLVVGSHRAASRAGVAAEVLERARRSVLVLPLTRRRARRGS